MKILCQTRVNYLFLAVYQQYFVFQSMDLKRIKAEEIRANRNKLKQTLKIQTQLIFPLQPFEKTEPETQQSSEAKKKRKKSECLKEYGTMGVFKDVSLKEQFEYFFVLKEKLGEGTHSVVYKCQEKFTGKLFAVKVTKRKDAELFENMREYYEIMKELDHEFIIKGTYLYISEKKMTCHLVEELCQYPELSNFIREARKQYPQNPAIQEKTVAVIAQNLLDCVAYLHQKGACHRDIKPENILYDPSSGQIKLIDFQLAKMERYANQKLSLWSKTGTLHYRAPETFKGEYNEAVDVWSIGIIMYEMLVGSLPFKNVSCHITIKQICQKEINYDELNISWSAKYFLRRLLEKDPLKRITAREALSCLFIMLNTRKSKLKLSRLQSFSETEEEKLRTSEKQIHYYDESAKSRFKRTTNKDIGVRMCGEE